MSTEYTRPGTLYRDEFCVPEAQYQFTINDSSGDGICCEYGEGSYTVLYGAGDGATVVAFGGEFGEFDSTTFEVVVSTYIALCAFLFYHNLTALILT